MHIHTMEYYLALRGNEILLDAATCMDAENIMLSEISQILHDSPESEVSRRVKFVVTEWNRGYQGLGDLLFKRYSFSLLLLSRFSGVRLCATPEMATHQAPPSLGFSRQEHWSGLPFPSTMHESEK